MSSLTLKRTLRERAGRAVRLSSAMSKDAQIEGIMLNNLSEEEHHRQREHSYIDEFALPHPPLPRREVTLIIVERKNAQFVLDESAFVQEEPIEEIHLPTPKRWKVPLKIVSFKRATYVPDE